jgi:uncharacterized protein YpuA (DUF1002 family)
MRSVICALVVLAMAPAGAVARAAPAGGVDRPRRGLDRGSPDEARVQETVELYMLVRLKEEVGLSEQQEARVMPVVRQMMRQRRESAIERRRIAEDLQRMLEQKPLPEQQVQDAVERLLDLEREEHRRQEKSHEELASMLGTEQQARLILFQDRFVRDIQDRLREVRRMRIEQRRGERGRFGGPPSGPDDR